MAEQPEIAAPTLLFDGVCKLCNGWVRFLLKFDHGGSMRFAALDSEAGLAIRDRHPELADVDSVIFVRYPGATDERVSIRSDAILDVLRYLGGLWRVLLIGAVVPRPIRDWVYNQVAKSRYRLFGTYDTCPIPPPAARKRFLD